MKLCVLRAVALLVLGSLLGACGGTPSMPTTTMTYDRQFNFSDIRKIYIEPTSRTDAATIQINDAQIKRIDGALAAELGRKGFQVVTASRQADLFLDWYLVTEDPVPASGSCDGCSIAIRAPRQRPTGWVSLRRGQDGSTSRSTGCARRAR